MPPPKPPTSLANGKFQVDKLLGAGCFGQVWRGTNTQTKDVIAIKFEDNQGGGGALQLAHEQDMLKMLANKQGFAAWYWFGTEGRFTCLVMEMLGQSLEDRLQGCNGKFSPQTCVLIADQVLCRIEYLHSLGILHRDIKPENFMFGIDKKVHHIYLIDFGLSKRYFDQKHVTERKHLSLTGTARYASINAHRGIEQSRRDDLEAIGHMFLCFLRGSLPWSGLNAKTQEEKYRRIREKKESTPLDDLCSGFPTCFQKYMETARGLRFEERPDYVAYRKLFADERADNGPQDDHGFQFLQSLSNKDKVNLDPLEVNENVTQPDDVAVVKSGGGCCTVS